MTIIRIIIYTGVDAWYFIIKSKQPLFFRRSSELKVFRAYKPFSTIELNAHSTEKACDEYGYTQVKPTYNMRYYNI